MNRAGELTGPTTFPNLPNDPTDDEHPQMFKDAVTSWARAIRRYRTGVVFEVKPTAGTDQNVVVTATNTSGASEADRNVNPWTSRLA